MIPPADPDPAPPLGFFAARPWIWVLLGYLLFVVALTIMVVIAVKNVQPDMLTPNGH